MKKILWLILLSLFVFTSCGGNSWQEQYDLGMRYLDEGNYAEAIIAFDKAIEIDPKQPLAYVGRADTYIASGETDDNLTAALADYTVALELDETNANAWLGLADVHIRQGKFGRAMEILQEALEKTNNADSIANKLSELENIMNTDIRGTLNISDYSYSYEAGGEITTWPGNDGAVGGMDLSFTVNAPEDTKNVYIATWEKYFTEKEVRERASFYIDIWKKEDASQYHLNEVPFDVMLGHPVMQEELGQQMQVLLIGTDENGDMTGYAIVTEQIPMQ